MKIKRKVLLISIGIITLISVSLLVYKNMNFYKPIDDNIYFSFYNGDKPLGQMPLKDNNEGLVFDHGECDNGAIIKWNNEEWAPLVKNLSKSKTKCSLYFRDKNTMANLSITSCDNHITATASGVEGVQITKYEYKIDEEDWFTGSEIQEFNDQSVGNHTVKLRVTNDAGEVSKEEERSITINKQRTVEIYGKQIPIATCQDGLYEVTHDVSEISTDWNKTEYRYAGTSPNNYVSFNNELWRIIGLVNVKTENGVEQRLKIVRTNGGSNQKDFWFYNWNEIKFPEYSNNWNTSFLKDMLNGIYYESEIGDCYYSKFQGYISEISTCDFTGNGDQPKGLDELARNMIDSNVIWSIGGSDIEENEIAENTIDLFYEKERSMPAYENFPDEWSNETDVGGKHNGIGLIYPSDHGYATNGGSLGRNACFAQADWHSPDIYLNECYKKNWLKPLNMKYNGIYTISPRYRINDSQLDAGSSYGVFVIARNSGIYPDTIDSSYVVYPTVYLKSNINITSGNGTMDDPYVLQLNA